jgi:nucleoid DNA-binding protein
LGISILALTLAARAQAPRGPAGSAPGGPPRVGTLPSELAKAAKLKEAEVKRALDALGPAIRDQLRAGRQIDLKGLGMFRVTRVAEHRDLVGGRPVVVPAVNYIEFVPAGDLANAANAPGATPARIVPPFEYDPRPGVAPGLKTGSSRIPGTRTR